jgi:6-bladed beta-propeller protein
MIASLLVAWLVSPGHSPPPSDTVTVMDKVACQTCVITVTKVADIDRRGELEIDPITLTFAMIAGNRLAFTGIGQTNNVAIFDRRGAFERYLGRLGSGPGEFQSARQVVTGSADSIFVLDRATRRISVFSAELKYQRGISTDALAPYRVVALPHGGFVVAGRSSTREAAGWPLHFLANEGGISRPFGDPLAAFRPGLETDLMRQVALAEAGSVWVSKINRYELELRRLDGTLEMAVFREADWFLPWETNYLPVEARPHPTVQALQVDARGRIWVFISVASTRFRVLRKPPALLDDPRRERPLPPLLDIFANYDTMIEVIDPAAGAVVARRRVPGLLYPAQKFPLSVRIVEDPDGSAHLELLTFSFDEGTPGTGARPVKPGNSTFE